MRERAWICFLAVCLLCSISLPGSPAAWAAPGDFLLQWGRPLLFDAVYGIDVDSGGNLYVVDNFRVQFFDKTGALIRTWGSYGSGNNQFRSPVDVAVAGNRVYVSDSTNLKVQVFDTSGNFVRTLVSGGSFGHGRMATDDSGSLYLVDNDNQTIEIFDSNGDPVRSFGGYGTGNSQFRNIQDLAVDEAGNIYVSDNNRIKVFTNAGVLLRDWGAYGTDPVSLGAVSVDAFGNVYVGENSAAATGRYGKLQVFDSGGNFLREWGSFGDADGEFNGIQSIKAAKDGNIYVSDLNNRVQIFDGSGKFLRKLGGTDANGQFAGVEGVAVDGAGKVYVTDPGNHRIQAFDGRGKFLWKSGSYGSGDGQFIFPAGVAVDSAGNVYAADGTAASTIRSRIQIFNSSGMFLAKWELPSGAADPVPGGLALDRNGNVYVADVSNYRIIMFGPKGNVVRTWGGKGSGNGQFDHPYGVAVDPVGNIYVADSNNHRIQVFDNEGNFLRSWGKPGSGDGEFNNVLWVGVDGTGNVYVTDYDSSAVARVQVFDRAGRFLGKWGSFGWAPGHFITPSGVAATASGDKVYVADWGNNRMESYVGFAAPPAGWLSSDIGSVRLAGSDDYQNGTFTLEGAGDNIAGTADSFHFVYRALSGDGQITARVVSVENTNGYAKGGVMIRESLAANSANAMMDVTPAHGADFWRRLTTGGTTTGNTFAGIAPPYWVRLVRKGTSFSGYLSSDGVTWTLAGTTTINMANSVYIGLLANSHNSLALCTVTLDSVSVTGGSSTPLVTITAPAEGTTYNAPASVTISAEAVAGSADTVTSVEFYSGTTLIGTDSSAPYTATWNNVAAGSYTLTAKASYASGATATSTPLHITVTSSTLPAPWATQDVGSVRPAGSASYLNGTFTVKGSGSDIWGTADGFRFVYQPLNGDGQIVARVVSVQNTNTYAKAGVMIRQSLAANSAHAMMDLRAAAGAAFSRRTTSGGTTASTTRSGVSAPYWVKLVRSGSTFTGSVSSDGVTWVRVGSATISMTGTAYVGLAVTSHNNGVLCTGTFANVTVSGSDNIAPSVTAFSIPATSSSLTVPITTFTATDNVGVTGYLVTESSTKPSATASGWSATPPASYTFASAGAKTVYAWAKDAAGNVSNSGSASVTIGGIDNIAPMVTAFSIPATSLSLTVIITTFTATDNVGVTGYLVTESATVPSATDPGWSATPPASYSFASAGAKTVYAWAKDAAGNVSNSLSASVTVSTDVLPAPLCQDWQTAQVGAYLVQNNVWGKGSVTGYSQCVGIGGGEEGTVAARWTWNWPTSTTNVKGYPELIFGRKPLHETTTPDLPRQINSIESVAVSFDYASTHSGRGNTAFDLWLSRALEVTPENKIELMVWLDWYGGMNPAGSYLTSATIGGRDYDLWVTTASGQPYYAYRMKSPLVGSVSLDMRPFLDHLRETGLLTGDEYLQSVEFGNEACNGTGDTSVFSYSVLVR